VQPTRPAADRNRARELRILKEIAEGLNGAADVEQALRDALSRVARLLGVRTGWVWLIDPRSGRFYNAAAQDLPPFLREPVRMTGKSCWCIKAFKSGDLTAENIDIIECSRLREALKPARRTTRGLRYHASIPLYFGTRPLGIMNLATPHWRRLNRRELDLLSTIASQVGIAIERARLAEESVRLARTEERARLARDLHDTLTQGLTAIGLHVEAALGTTGDSRMRAQLQRALAVTRSSLDRARHALGDLRRSPLNGRPLAEALADLGRDMSSDTGVRVHVRSAPRVSVPPDLEEELFRIASEALTNVRRHAAASEVDVILVRLPRRIRLTVADNGTGFDARATHGGFGLIGMRERAALIGSRLRVRSRRGHGTTIEVSAPLAGRHDSSRASVSKDGKLP
jgi:two-component system NarL family sensor kinase